jgi:hypothetical protein
MSNPQQDVRMIKRYFEISFSERYVRLPFVGAGHYDGWGWVWDWWSELKRTDLR